jgi:hypothetical protein
MPHNALRNKRDLRHLLKRGLAVGLEPGTVKRKFPQEYYKHGKRFLDHFPHRIVSGKAGSFLVDIRQAWWEAPVSIAIVSKVTPKINQITGAKSHPVYRHFEAKLDFNRDAVVVKGLQGEKGDSKGIQTFESVVGCPAANYLLGVIEDHARASGYREVRITHLKHSRWIKNIHDDSIDQAVRRTSRGRKLLDKEEERTREEEKELSRLEIAADEQILKRRRKIYTATARKRGYTSLKHYYRKRL